MNVVRPAIGLLLSAGLVGGGLLGSAGTAAGWSEPPPVILKNPHSQQVAVGNSVTFTASAKYAVLVFWGVKAPADSGYTFYSGTNTTTKNGKLKSSFTFGPFVASENGWQVVAAFINDPTGVPSGIQTTASKVAYMTLK